MKYQFILNYIFITYLFCLSVKSIQVLSNQRNIIKSSRTFVNLPVFTFDFHNILVSAIIERSTISDDIFLSMYFLNPILFNMTSAIEAISTEENVIHDYTSMVLSLNYMTFLQDNHIFCKLHHQLEVTNSGTTNSGYHRRSKSYLSHAFWSSVSNNSASHILKCKLRNLKSLNQHMALQVDLIMRSNKSSNASSHDPKSIIVNFQVPWHSRYHGYGFHLYPNSSLWNPWTRSLNHSYSQPQIALCSGVSRPLNPTRADVALPMLIEYVVYNLEVLKYDHIFLGVLIDIQSATMSQYILVFHKYIQLGKLSIIPLSLVGFEDIAFIYGLIVNISLIENLFMSQCLAMTKGVFDYITILHPYESFYSIDQGHTSSIHSFLPRPHSHSNTRLGNHKRHTYSLNRNHVNILDTPSYVMTSLQYGMIDPLDSFGVWGSGDSSWARDFFASSPTIGPIPKSPLIVLLSPDDAENVDFHNHIYFSNKYITNIHLNQSQGVILSYQSLQSIHSLEWKYQSSILTNSSIELQEICNSWKQGNIFITQVLDSMQLSSILQLKQLISQVSKSMKSIQVYKTSDIKTPFWLRVLENKTMENLLKDLKKIIN